MNKKKLLKIVRYAAYPAFYLFCLLLFGYLSFPYDQLKDRLIAEFDKSQQKSRRRGREPMRLEIDELDSHWISGVEITGAKLIIPPKPARRGGSGMMASMGGEGDKDKEPAKPAVIAIDQATVRVRMLPLLVGSVMLDFAAEAFGGQLEGSAPLGGDGEVTVELEGVQLNEIGPLKDMVEGLPILGVMSGSLRLEPKEGKFAKADGKLELRMEDVIIGDGKTKVQGVALPGAQVGLITIEATAADGTLTIDEMSAHGRDFELIGDGKIKLHESWERAQADFYLKFKFADAYRDKNDSTKSLLGDSAGKIKPAIELLPTSPFRRAKTDDGFYRFHFSGPLGNLEPRPAGKSSPAARPGRAGKAPTARLPRTPARRVAPTPDDDSERAERDDAVERAREQAEREAKREQAEREAKQQAEREEAARREAEAERQRGTPPRPDVPEGVTSEDAEPDDGSDGADPAGGE